jgi:hypothetical protein
MTYIINNLRVIISAKQQRGFEHPQSGDVLLTEKDISPFLGSYNTNEDGSLKRIAGEIYSIKSLSDHPEAILTQDVKVRNVIFPKGFVIRWDTNVNAYMLPNKPQ